MKKNTKEVSAMSHNVCSVNNPRRWVICSCVDGIFEYVVLDSKGFHFDYLGYATAFRDKEIAKSVGRSLLRNVDWWVEETFVRASHV